MRNSRSKEGIQVVTAVARRRRFSPQDKIVIVNKTRLYGNSVSSVAREHGIAPSVLFTWRKLMEQGELESVTSEEDVVADSKMKEMQNRIKSLERILGRKTEEVEILKEASGLHAKKN